MNFNTLHRDNVLQSSLNSIFCTLATENKVEKKNRKACISRIMCKINLQGPQTLENDQQTGF